MFDERDSHIFAGQIVGSRFSWYLQSAIAYCYSYGTYIVYTALTVTTGLAWTREAACYDKSVSLGVLMDTWRYWSSRIVGVPSMYLCATVHVWYETDIASYRSDCRMAITLVSSVDKISTRHSNAADIVTLLKPSTQTGGRWPHKRRTYSIAATVVIPSRCKSGFATLAAKHSCCWVLLYVGNIWDIMHT